MAESSSEQRSLPPSERRLAQARRAGDVAVSRDLVAGMAFAGACVALIAGGRSWIGGLAAYLHTALARASSSDLPSASLGSGLAAAAAALALPVGVSVAVALLAGLAQTRGVFTSHGARAQRFVPSLGRVLERERVVDTALDLGKLTVLLVVATASLLPCAAGLVALSGAEAVRVPAALGAALRRLGCHLAITMVALGFADYLWQRARYQGRLRMTRDEARREQKEDEGVPEPKAERRRRHRELLAGTALADVARADFILVLPGAAAAAIAHAGGADDVPRMLAWGEHLRARRIEAVARAAGLATFVEPALVRALAFVEEGDEVPEPLHAAVARLLVRAKAARMPARPGAEPPGGHGE
jgi:flagellar biosynthesis protein FlhB